MGYPKWPFLFLPWTRRELPGWGAILEAAHVGESEPDVWKGAPTLPMRGKWHGFLVNCDMEVRYSRRAYFLGRLGDLPLQLCMTDLIGRGETYIDIGAAGGAMMLHAMGCTGPDADIYAVEPNPNSAKKIRALMDLNGPPAYTLLEHALGAEVGELTLRIVGEESGTGTLAELSGEELDGVTEEHRVAVHVGDEVFYDRITGPAFIKMDVEGFELNVVKGLERTLADHRPVLVLEVIDRHLERAGATRDELFSHMEARGYRGFVLDTRRVGLKQKIVYIPCREAAERYYAGFETDVVWVHADSPQWERLERVRA